MTSRRALTIFLILASAIAAVSLYVFEPYRAAVSCLLGWTALAIAVYDAENLIIPDVLSLPLIPFGLIAVWLLDGADAEQASVLEHIAAAIAGCGLLYAVRQGYYLWRDREGLGLGDVKLGAAAGAWTGLQGLSNVLLLACVLAISYVVLLRFYKKSSITAMTAVPFGIFLAPSIWVIWCIDFLAVGTKFNLLAATP
ncbi:A24 family peptidase [Hyphomicrobium sp.]|jgi:leader peptidase (prepilin peptidase)/N-methyltransferase|uniref:prepilin peptidase n=1 Tax=Hyphomicrobium sp. TaxID=82 RepID=UPI0035619CF1